MADEKTKKINLELPEKIHKKLKIKCIAMEVSIKDYVVSLIEDDIKNTDYNKLIENE